jgi:hypothetical protein
LRVRVCHPVSPADHPTARGLLRETRAAMLANLDEPDLAPPASPDRGRGQGSGGPEGPREERRHIPA